MISLSEPWQQSLLPNLVQTITKVVCFAPHIQAPSNQVWCQDTSKDGISQADVRALQVSSMPVFNDLGGHRSSPALDDSPDVVRILRVHVERDIASGLLKAPQHGAVHLDMEAHRIDYRNLSG